MPDPTLLELEEVREDDWDVGRLIGGVWTIFPHVSVANFDAGGKLYMVSQLFPGSSPDESTTIQSFLAAFEPTEESRTRIDEQMAFLRHVVENEDYYTGRRIQRAVKTGAKRELLFGRNEGGGHRFHRWVEALIQTDDENVTRLFTSARS